MLTPGEFEAILERIRTSSATEADFAALRQVLKLHGEFFQVDLQQGKYNVNIGKVEGQDIQFGDRIYKETDAEAIRKMLREVLGLAELLPPSPEEQREAICQFLQSTYERFSSVEFLHRRGQKVALRDQYIPIQVTLDKQPEKSSAGRYLGYVESEAELQRAYALKREDDKREQIDWQEAKKKHQRIMVLADPGMGKTTLLRMEAGTLAQQEQQALANDSKALEAVILPVWLRLSNLAEQVQQATDTVLEAILGLVKAEWDEQQFAKLKPTLEEKLRKGQCLILLDALDEVPRQLRDRLTVKLNDFDHNYTCPIICTSRIVGYTSLLSGATEVEIVPFNPQQTKIYIEKWFTNATDVLDETVSAKELIQELQSKPQIQGLATNPLMLSLICSLYQEQGITLPARRCEVYAKAVEYMLGKWSRNSRKHTGAKLQAKTRLLECLAYQFTCDGVEIFSEDQLYIKLSEYLEDSKIPTIFRKFETDDPLEELAEDGILQKLSEKEYLFFHRTFQEYFTASYLVRADEAGIQLAKAHLWNFEWQETISLMAGRMEKPLDLIQEILKEKDDIFYTQLLLAGRCLVECAESTHLLMLEAVKNTVHAIHQFWCHYPDSEVTRSAVVTLGKANLGKLKPLQQFLQDEESDVRAYAAEALGEIGSTEAVAALIQVLQDEDYHFRQCAAEALGEIGSTEAVAALIQALQDENYGVRVGAAQALGEIGSTEAVAALIQALQDENYGVRGSAIGALGKIDSTEAVAALIQTLQSENYSVRGDAAQALGEIGSTEAVAALIQTLQSENYSVRGDAAQALGEIGSIEAVPALIQTLQDKDDVRGSAIEALGKIAIAHPSFTLLMLLQHPNPKVSIDRPDIFWLVRQLAIRVSREGSNCVPVYPERVKSLNV